jgi:hypothetical protein
VPSPACCISSEIGRLPSPDEDVPGTPRVVILSDGIRKRLFNSDLGMVGKSITLNGIESIFLLLGSMALARIRSLEQTAGAGPNPGSAHPARQIEIVVQ